MKRNIVKLLGLPIDTFGKEEALSFAAEISGQIITINTEMIAYAKKHHDFARIIEEADMIIPDSIGVEIGLKILRHKVHRIAGIVFAKELVRNFAEKDKSCHQNQNHEENQNPADLMTFALQLMPHFLILYLYCPC